MLHCFLPLNLNTNVNVISVSLVIKNTLTKNIGTDACNGLSQCLWLTLSIS